MSYQTSIDNTNANIINEFIDRFTKKTSVDIKEYDDGKIEFIFNKKQNVMVEVYNNLSMPLPNDIGHHKLLIIACALTLKGIKMYDNQYITNGFLNDNAYQNMLVFAEGFTKKRKAKKSKKQRKIKKKSKTFRRFA
jgi:hypothetical protein